MTNVSVSSSNDTTMIFKSWDFTKGHSDVVDSWFLMGNPIAMFSLIVSYLVFVLYLGPIVMKNRQPFKLKYILLAYNICQVAMSLYIMNMGLPHILKHGFTNMECFIAVDELKAQLLVGMWYYFFAKATELLDTVFFVLRKKANQISFLHVYHHTVLAVTSWIYLKYTPTEHVLCLGFINSFVHVIMYAYYALSALGPSITPYLFWKKYITTIQLIQFVLILYQLVAGHFISTCPQHVFWVYYFSGNLLLFIYLFADFYKKTYNKSKQEKSL